VDRSGGIGGQGFLQLLLKGGKDLRPRSRCKMPPFLVEVFVRCREVPIRVRSLEGGVP
jgi:hypothetical protein